jgi:hypothetical protein
MSLPWTFIHLHRRRALARVVPIAVIVGGALAAGWAMRPAERVEAPTHASRAEASPEVAALAGIWWRYEAAATGERVRFYYFHGDGTGLYRYGRTGLTNTHSFDYDVQGDDLLLTFRKTGDRHVVRFRLERRATEAARDKLTLYDDPREPTETTYFRTSDRTVRDASIGPASIGVQGESSGPGGRLWIDLRNYATGGRGFSMYQLRAPGIDGRGTGWFHRGDFDDWSTESLTYRIAGDRLEMVFELAGEKTETRFRIAGEGDDRTLALEDDPRDYWHAHAYRDAGPSFGVYAPVAELAGVPVP